MFDLFLLLVNILIVVAILHMLVQTLLLRRVLVKMPQAPRQKSQITVEGESDATPLPEPEPAPKEPLDLDVAFEELWTVLEETGVYVTQDWFIQAWFGRENYHSYNCSDGRVLVWYGKQSEVVHLAVQQDQQARKAAKKQQKGNAA